MQRVRNAREQQQRDRERSVSRKFAPPHRGTQSRSAAQVSQPESASLSQISAIPRADEEDFSYNLARRNIPPSSIAKRAVAMTMGAVGALVQNHAAESSVGGPLGALTNVSESLGAGAATAPLGRVVATGGQAAMNRSAGAASAGVVPQLLRKNRSAENIETGSLQNHRQRRTVEQRNKVARLTKAVNDLRQENAQLRKFINLNFQVA